VTTHERRLACHASQASLAASPVVGTFGTMAAEPAPGSGTDGAGTSTAPAPNDDRAVRRSRASRRVFIVALVAFLAVGALGGYGVRTRSTRSSGGGYDLEVRYASVTRPGLASPWSVEIRRAGGFDGPVRLATTARYFDSFDENGLSPDPTASTTDGERIIWEFEPPPGDMLVVSFDARIEPAVQLSWVTATTSVLDGDTAVASVRYRTVVLP